jgi:hypothetical protein
VVIEAFACERPRLCVEAMASRACPPVWLNLEYLSAEAWVDGCHRQPSPHPRLPLVKHFYFPGFTAGTGGLLRERDYDARRALRRGGFPRRIRLAAAPARGIDDFLFSYPNPALPGLIEAWAAGHGPTVPLRVLRPGGSDAAQAIGNLTCCPALPAPGPLRRTALGLRPELRPRRGLFRPRPMGRQALRLADLSPSRGRPSGQARSLSGDASGRCSLAPVLACLERGRPTRLDGIRCRTALP